ncbi:hypothetical protein DL546_001402 [Coniochaeta pulveracea]|uniref:Uncharacterized protein n=1 Tax=Coniochaeta pulveracea TaxID=177199 RepID=A0A420Y890_9PEZI|nr:hypothetical protein DL546_001402 [Coniochaeta pulveracea]
MFNLKTTTLFLAGSVLSLFSSVSAQDTQYPEPITLGILGYPHGHQLLAWSPTRTSMVDACNGYEKPTRTVIQVDNSGYPSNPICNHVFSLDGYEGLELLCAGNETLGTMPQVTAIATNGTQTHRCVELPYGNGFYSTPCDETHITSISQSFACQ